MEALQLLQEVPKAALGGARFLVEHLTTGAWGLLADLVYSDQTHALSMEHLDNVVKGEE